MTGIHIPTSSSRASASVWHLDLISPTAGPPSTRTISAVLPPSSDTGNTYATRFVSCFSLPAVGSGQQHQVVCMMRSVCESFKAGSRCHRMQVQEAARYLHLVGWVSVTRVQHTHLLRLRRMLLLACLHTTALGLHKQVQQPHSTCNTVECCPAAEHHKCRAFKQASCGLRGCMAGTGGFLEHCACQIAGHALPCAACANYTWAIQGICEASMHTCVQAVPYVRYVIVEMSACRRRCASYGICSVHAWRAQAGMLMHARACPAYTHLPISV